MKHYKDSQNNLFGIEEGQNVPDGLIEITIAEVNEINKTTDDNTFANLSYAQKRAREYPPIGDQLDALFHAGVFPPEMAAKLQAVKDKYPKG